MTSHAKFLFEARFDGDAPPPPRPRKHFTADEVEAARKAAEKAGAEAGRAQALREVEARAAAALDVLAREVGGAMSDIREAHDAAMREHLATAAEIVRRLFPALSERAEFGEIESLLASCLEHVASQPRVIVRLPDAFAATIQPRLEEVARRAGFAGDIVVVADPDLPGSRARIEWADGSAERDSARTWSEIDAILAPYVGDATGIAMDQTNPAREEQHEA